MEHLYTDEFYDYIDADSHRSATRLIDRGLHWLSPSSVLDVGCGRGAWLRHWLKAGVEDICGVDGDYVSRNQLGFAAQHFVEQDLSLPFDLGRRFDLVQSLEVAEHLPSSASEEFVRSLANHGDQILFSAAVPGQGGEHHVNERPLDYWRDRFATFGFRCFDCVRPKVAGDEGIKPWYRYNSLLYVRGEAAEMLPEEVLAAEVEPGAPIHDVSSLPWRLRRALVARLPRNAVTRIAQFNARRATLRGQ